MKFVSVKFRRTWKRGSLETEKRNGKNELRKFERQKKKFSIGNIYSGNCLIKIKISIKYRVH